MEDVPAKNTPMLAGWLMAAGFGLVAMGAGYVAIGLSAMGAAFVGALIFTVTGIVLGLPTRSLDRPGDAAQAKEAAPVHPVIHVSAAVAPAVAAQVVAASRPAGLATAREGRADDLKIIKGVGPKLEELCHSLGYYHFDQIAAWTDAEIAWVDDNLEGFKGRVSRDRWVPQAKAILAHGKDEFLRRLDAGETF